jgi:integrase
MYRANKLALHLLLLLMVRKSELTGARWEEVDFDAAKWSIPAERMKMEHPHLVPLPRQAVEMLRELHALAGGSEWIFPSNRARGKRPISKTTLNAALRGLDLGVRPFTIHDLRRTASTHLHEAGFNGDWIEMALAHKTQGVRGVYNRARYLEDRRAMHQWWSDMVDSLIDDGRKVIIGRFGKESLAS